MRKNTKKSDNYNDIVVTKKNDAEADKGELYYSRDKNHLAYKRGPGDSIKIFTEGDIVLPVVGEYIITSDQLHDIKTVPAQITPHFGLGTYYSGLIRIELHPGDQPYDFNGEPAPQFQFVFETGANAIPYQVSCVELPDNNKIVWFVDLNTQKITSNLRTNINVDMLTQENNGLFLKIYGPTNESDYINADAGSGFLRVVYELNVHTFGE